VIRLAKFISTDDWADYLHEGLISQGIVPDEDMIMLIIDLTLDFFESEDVIDFTLEIE
jgi:hypothetical protein